MLKELQAEHTKQSVIFLNLDQQYFGLLGTSQFTHTSALSRSQYVLWSLRIKSIHECVENSAKGKNQSYSNCKEVLIYLFVLSLKECCYNHIKVLNRLWLKITFQTAEASFSVKKVK